MKLHPLIKIILLCFAISLSSCTYTTKLGDKLLPDSEYNTLVVKADAAMHDGEWEKAATFYEKAGQLKPDDWSIKLKQAQAHQNDGKLAQAFNTYQIIIDAKSATDTTLKTAKESQAKLGFKTEPVTAPEAVELAKPSSPEPDDKQVQEVTLSDQSPEAQPQEAQKPIIVQAESSPSQASADQVQSSELSQAAPNPQVATIQSKFVMDHVTSWAKAWAEKNIKVYFAHYADDFAGEFSDASAWRQSRTAKILKAKQIKISFSDIQINNISAELVEVTFKQVYQSGTYQDSGKKTLSLKKMNGHWRITQETFK